MSRSSVNDNPWPAVRKAPRICPEGQTWEKHRVAFWESEELFFNQPLLLVEDVKHSRKEERFYALGKTDAERYLFAVFTVRNKHIRVISVRDMSRKERK